MSNLNRDGYIEHNKYSRAEIVDIKTSVDNKKVEIQEIYKHYKTHFEAGSQELSELRCVTAVCIMAQEEKLRRYIFSSKIDDCVGYWNKKFKVGHYKAQYDMVLMAEYAKKNGHKTDINQFEFFGLDWEKYIQKVLTEVEVEEIKDASKPKNKIGFY